MRNRIFGAVGIFWGGAIVLNHLFGETPHGSDAYQTGLSGAFIFGILMFLAGGYYFFKKPNKA